MDKLVGIAAGVNCTTGCPSTVVNCGCSFICRKAVGRTMFLVSICVRICWSELPSFNVMGRKHLLVGEKIFRSCS